MMTMDTRNMAEMRTRSAYHETGHLITALLLNFPFLKNKVAAELYIGKKPRTNTKKFVYNKMTIIQKCLCYIVLFAGEEIEKLNYKDDAFRDGLKCDDKDIKKCDIALKLEIKDIEKIKILCKKICKEILENRVEEINKIVFKLDYFNEITLLESKIVLNITDTYDFKEKSKAEMLISECIEG